MGLAIVATVCALGIVFYVRFVIALCAECIHRRVCYLVRLHIDSDQYLASETTSIETSMPRAA